MSKSGVCGELMYFGCGRPGVFPQDPGAEADRPALHVADRDHQAAAEAIVVAAAVVAPDDQPGRLDLAQRVAFAGQPVLQRIPTVQRVAELPGFPGLLRQAAALQVLPGDDRFAGLDSADSGSRRRRRRRSARSRSSCVRRPRRAPRARLQLDAGLGGQESPAPRRNRGSPASSRTRRRRPPMPQAPKQCQPWVSGNTTKEGVFSL